jgi:integrase
LVRSLVERVLDAAAVEAGIDDYSNPAVWKGKLEHLLSGTSPEVEHFAAMDYKAVPAFLADAADPLLTFLVLTASRLSEATGADWSEIDGNVWTIPAANGATGSNLLFALPSSLPGLCLTARGQLSLPRRFATSACKLKFSAVRR